MVLLVVMIKIKGKPGSLRCAPDDALPGKGVCRTSCKNKSTSYPNGKICPYYPCSKINEDLLANCKKNPAMGGRGTVDCCSFLKNQINPANCAICSPGACGHYNPTQGNKGASGSPGGGKKSCISQYTYDNNFKGCSSTSVCGRVPGACIPTSGTSSCDYEIGNPPSGDKCYSTTPGLNGLFSQPLVVYIGHVIRTNLETHHVQKIGESVMVLQEVVPTVVAIKIINFIYLFIY